MAQPRVVEVAAYLVDDDATTAFWELIVSALGANVTEVYPGYPLIVKADREISPSGASTRVTKFGVLLGPDGSFLAELPGGGGPGGGDAVPVATAIAWNAVDQWVDVTYPDGWALGGTAYCIFVTEAGTAYTLGEATDMGTFLRVSGLSDTINGLVGRMYFQASTGLVLQSDGTTTAEVDPPPGS